MQWERADLPWELPDYIGKFAQALKETQAWITTGGVAAPATEAPLQMVPPTNLTLPAPSNGKSEVSVSDKELLTPKCLLSKVQQVDDIEHVLDKGAWVAMLAMHWGWEIFVEVSSV